MSPDQLAALAAAGLRLAGAAASIPITNQMVADGQMFQPIGAPTEAPPSAMAAVTVGSNRHNTNLHVGGILLAAGALIAVYHLAGFRMGFDVGLGRG